MTVPPFHPPRLLVSVRNDVEAEAALSGGCDVLDVKEPARGALGMADPVTIAGVVARVHDLKASVPVSVALGEVAEWEGQRPVPRLPARIAYLKLGTAGLGSDAAWAKRYAEVKRRIAGAEHGTAGDGKRDTAKWIAVGNADWEVARGPCPEAVIEDARACGCAGVLLDTFSKENGRLFDWLSIERLDSLAALARRYGLDFALAGRLQLDDLPRLSAVRPDIAGIRSAACRAGNRTGEIDVAAVHRFREALQATFCGHSPPVQPGNPGSVGVAQYR